MSSLSPTNESLRIAFSDYKYVCVLTHCLAGASGTAFVVQFRVGVGELVLFERPCSLLR